MDYKPVSTASLRFDTAQPNPSQAVARGLNGASIGVCLYTATEPAAQMAHEDQEGFYVIEGEGTAYLNDDAVPVFTGCAFLLPPGVRHTFVRKPNSPPLKMLWFHAAS